MSRDRVPAAPTPTPFIPDKSSVEYIRLGDTAFAAGEHERIAHEIYRAKVAEALADGEFTTTDTATLALVAESLEVPASNSEAILGEECRKVLQFALSASISDRRWSVDE